MSIGQSRTFLEVSPYLTALGCQTIGGYLVAIYSRLNTLQVNRMPNDNSTKSRKKKKKPTIRKAMRENSEERQPEAQPKFTSKAVESDDHYVVFQFEPANTAEGPPPPGSPAAETPSPAAGNAATPNDYEHMVPTNLQPSTQKSNLQDTQSVKSRKAKNKHKKEDVPRSSAIGKAMHENSEERQPESQPKFTSKAVESDDHYVVFQFEPANAAAAPTSPGTPAAETPSTTPSSAEGKAATPNDYEHMVPTNLQRSTQKDTQSIKSRKAKNKHKKEDVPRLEPESQPKKTSIESMSKKARKKKGANADKSTKSRKLKKNANKKKGGDGS
ncbi:hypothetical protein DdX_08404 [Ditylenchus destructor]|uniref:Uncharacterized protein n=1 Tax=Ditylenchus destructor TaxID=166010 RepID=A0AAD4N1Y1_9BILA|nr:hypothetical protein DdX_08404 [Ditylenchus destructor]